MKLHVLCHIAHLLSHSEALDHPSLNLEWPVVELKVVLYIRICQMCLSLNTDVKVLVSFIITSYSYPNVVAFVKSPSGFNAAS